MNEAVEYFKNMGIPFKNGLIDSEALTNEQLNLLVEWEEKTQDHGIMMPKIEDFYRSVLVAISLYPQKSEEGKINYLFGKGIGVEIALRGKVQGRNFLETNPEYRSHSDFELYDYKGIKYPESFKSVFGSQEIYPPTRTKGLNDIEDGVMDLTHEVVDLDGYEILLPRLELLFLDKFLRKESTPRESGYDCELLAQKYDLDLNLVNEYLEKYYFNYEFNKERSYHEHDESIVARVITKLLKSEIRDVNNIEEAIVSLNELAKTFQKMNENSTSKIKMYGIDVQTYVPLTSKDVLINEKGMITLTEEYIKRAKKSIANGTNIQMESKRNKVLQELNASLKKINDYRMIANQEVEELESYNRL